MVMVSLRITKKGKGRWSFVLTAALTWITWWS